MVQALKQTLVHKLVEHIELVGAGCHDVLEDILEHGLGVVHVVQNSAAWRVVLEFSARKVGPKVYTSPKAMAKFSALSWPDTVRLACFPKKSWLQSTSPDSVRGGFLGSSVVTRNISPAPSQSLVVMIGVLT